MAPSATELPRPAASTRRGHARQQVGHRELTAPPPAQLDVRHGAAGVDELLLGERLHAPLKNARAISSASRRLRLAVVQRGHLRASTRWPRLRPACGDRSRPRSAISRRAEELEVLAGTSARPRPHVVEPELVHLVRRAARVEPHRVRLRLRTSPPSAWSTSGMVRPNATRPCARRRGRRRPVMLNHWSVPPSWSVTAPRRDGVVPWRTW